MLNKIKNSIKSIASSIVDTLLETSILAEQEEFCSEIATKMIKYEQTIKEQTDIINNQKVKIDKLCNKLSLLDRDNNSNIALLEESKKQTVELYSELSCVTDKLLMAEKTINIVLKSNVEITNYNKILAVINMTLTISIVSYIVLGIFYN